MPNWCNNTVEVAHKDPARLKALVDAYNDGKFCSFAIPVPESLQIVAGRLGRDDDPKQIALEAAEKSNLETHGFANWYDFCVAKWGTKWDCGGDGDHIELEAGQDNTTLCFDSAWAPPIGVYEALVERGYEVRAYYYEPGMAFAGIWDNGDDGYYEIGGLSSETVKEAIPEALDEMFGISETIAEYENEEAE